MKGSAQRAKSGSKPVTAWWPPAGCDFDEQLALRRMTALWQELRWNSTERVQTQAARLATWMRNDGLQDVEVLGFPADGVSNFGGWRMPLCWSPRESRLEIVAPAGATGLVADYRKEPLSLVMYSASTRAGGVEADLVLCKPARIPASRVKGRIVLFDDAPDRDAVRRARLAGALGFVTDAMPEYKGIRTSADTARAVPYCNALLPPWRVPARERGFGFAVSPETGRRLRALLAAGSVRVRATVTATLEPGELPVVTGYLRGRTGQEVLITAHMDEPGANDNASGVAVALGIGRMLASATRSGWTPERGVRFFFSVETRGLMAFLNTNPKLFHNGVSGLNLDMLGADQAASGATLKIAHNQPALPDPILPLLLRNLAAMPGLRWKLGQDCGDNAMGDPLVGISTTMLVQAPDRTYHTNLDRPECLSATAVRRMGDWLGGHVGHLCSAGPAEIGELARLGVRYARRRLVEVARTVSERHPGEEPTALRHHAEQERRRLTGLLRLLPAEDQPVWVEGTNPALPTVNARGLSPETAAREQVERLAARIVPPVVRNEGIQAAAPVDRWAALAARRIPLKTFCGFLAAENLTPDVHRRLCRVAGGTFGWGAPWWLQWALGWSNGKRPLLQIGDLLRHEGRGVPCERLVRTFDILAREGFVRWRPRLTGRDLDRALRRVGVRPGILVMAHTSLSAFGYVEGGARTVIDRLQAAVGTAGTLVMPTHTVSTFGKPAYDAARTPSTVGSITEVFRKLDGVWRSLHPTHSMAARGPLAEALTAGHTGDMAPLAREGFWGRFIDDDGWVLMMAPLRKNTLMHAAELWSGVKLPGMVLAGRPGQCGAAHVIPSAPWHNNWFDLAHERMRRRGKIASAPLGEGTIYLMRGRDVVEAGLAVLRDDPLLVTKKGCHCAWCEIIRRRQGAGDRP